MRTFTKFALLAAGLAAFLGVTGCRRPHYRVSLESGEQIAVGSPVFLDDRTIGSVTQITQSDNGRVADIMIVDREARQAFRQGIQREALGAMRLSSVDVAPDAPALKTGAMIPTRSPISNLSKGAMAMIQDWLETATEWAWANPVIAVLGLLVALVILVGVLRAILTRGAVLLFFLLVLAASAADLQAAVKRAEVTQALQLAERQMDRAELDAADARRLTSVKLFRDAQDSAIRSLLLLHSVESAEADARIKIPQLGIFVGVDAKADLVRRVTNLAQRRATIADEVASLGPPAPSQERLVILYLEFRDDIEIQLARDGGTTDPEEIIGRLRLLAQYPPSLVTARIVNWGNVVELRRLEGNGILLPDGTTFGSVQDIHPAAQGAHETERLSRVEQAATQLRKELNTLAERTRDALRRPVVEGAQVTSALRNPTLSTPPAQPQHRADHKIPAVDPKETPAGRMAATVSGLSPASQVRPSNAAPSDVKPLKAPKIRGIVAPATVLEGKEVTVQADIDGAYKEVLWRVGDHLSEGPSLTLSPTRSGPLIIQLTVLPTDPREPAAYLSREVAVVGKSHRLLFTATSIAILAAVAGGIWAIRPRKTYGRLEISGPAGSRSLTLEKARHDLTAVFESVGAKAVPVAVMNQPQKGGMLLVEKGKAPQPMGLGSELQIGGARLRYTV